MKHNFKKNSLVVSILFLAISVFLFVFLYSQIKRNNEEREQKRIAWQTESSRRQDIKTLDQSIKMIEPEKALLESHFAQSSDVVPFLNTIESLGEKSGTTTNISSVDISSDNTFLMVGIKTTGTFEQVYKFVRLLENSSYELQFDSIDIHNAISSEELKKHTNGTPWEAIIKIKLLSFIS